MKDWFWRMFLSCFSPEGDTNPLPTADLCQPPASSLVFSGSGGGLNCLSCFSAAQCNAVDDLSSTRLLLGLVSGMLLQFIVPNPPASPCIIR